MDSARGPNGRGPPARATSMRGHLRRGPRGFDPRSTLCRGASPLEAAARGTQGPALDTCAGPPGRARTASPDESLYSLRGLRPRPPRPLLSLAAGRGTASRVLLPGAPGDQAGSPWAEATQAWWLAPCGPLARAQRRCPRISVLLGRRTSPWPRAQACSSHGPPDHRGAPCAPRSESPWISWISAGVQAYNRDHAGSSLLPPSSLALPSLPSLLHFLLPR